MSTPVRALDPDALFAADRAFLDYDEETTAQRVRRAIAAYVDAAGLRAGPPGEDTGPTLSGPETAAHGEARGLYGGFARDAESARAGFKYQGGAVRLVNEISDPVVRGMEWGHAEKDTYTVPFGPWSREPGAVSGEPWVWRYGTASADTGSRYAVLVTRVHGDVASREGGPIVVTVLAPWQDSYAVAAGGYLDESYVAEKLTAGRFREGRLHGGDLAALTMLLRILLGREE